MPQLYSGLAISTALASRMCRLKSATGSGIRSARVVVIRRDGRRRAGFETRLRAELGDARIEDTRQSLRSPRERIEACFAPLRGGEQATGAALTQWSSSSLLDRIPTD